MQASLSYAPSSLPALASRLLSQMPSVVIPSEEVDMDPSLRVQLPLQFGATEKKPQVELKKVLEQTRRVAAAAHGHGAAEDFIVEAFARNWLVMRRSPSPALLNAQEDGRCGDWASEAAAGPRQGR